MQFYLLMLLLLKPSDQASLSIIGPLLTEHYLSLSFVLLLTYVMHRKTNANERCDMRAVYVSIPKYPRHRSFIVIG
jgi:hypothetical protein